MKCLLSANTVAEEGTVQLLKSMLEEAGIACAVRIEALRLMKSGIASSECVPELWIMDDVDYAKAMQIVGEWGQSIVEPHAAWRCPQCQETNEGQFTACWKCGNELQET